MANGSFFSIEKGSLTEVLKFEKDVKVGVFPEFIIVIGQDEEVTNYKKYVDELYNEKRNNSNTNQIFKDLDIKVAEDAEVKILSFSKDAYNFLIEQSLGIKVTSLIVDKENELLIQIFPGGSKTEAKKSLTDKNADFSMYSAEWGQKDTFVKKLQKCSKIDENFEVHDIRAKNDITMKSVNYIEKDSSIEICGTNEDDVTLKLQMILGEMGDITSEGYQIKVDDEFTFMTITQLSNPKTKSVVGWKVALQEGDQYYNDVIAGLIDCDYFLKKNGQFYILTKEI